MSLAEASRGGRTGKVIHSYSGRWLYSVVGVAAGVALTLLARPLLISQDGVSSNPIVENDPIVRPALVAGSSKSVIQPVRAPAGGCKGCERVVTTGEGFCCGKGRSFGVPMTSKRLYAVLVGQKLDAAAGAKYPCKECPETLKSHSKCHHKKLMVGRMYQSPVSYRLAKGTPTPEFYLAAFSPPCKSCMSAYKVNGRCDLCCVGFVAGRMYDDAEEHKAALVAYKTLTKAAKFAAQCESCAVAIVTDGRCDGCNASFKDGIKIAHDG